MRIHSANRLGFVVFMLMHQWVLGGIPENPLKEKENVEINSATERSVRDKSGNVRHQYFMDPVFYRDESGAWLEVTPGFGMNVKPNHSTYPYTQSADRYESYFPAGAGSTGILNLISGQRVTEWLNPGISYIDGKGELSIHYFEPGQRVDIAGTVLTYRDVLPAIDVEYIQKYGKRKMNIHIQNASGLGKIPKGAKDMIAFEHLQLPEGWSLSLKGQEIEILNTKGEISARIESPEIFELDYLTRHRPDAHIYGTWQVESKGNGLWKVGIVCPVDWLMDVNRSFPVVIDPTINFYPQNASMWSGHLTSATTAPVADIMRIAGTGTYTFAKFDISALPYNAIISDVSYWGFHYSGSSSTLRVVRINDLGSLDPSVATGPEISSRIDQNISYNASYGFAQSSTTYGWKQASLSGNIIQDLYTRSITRGWTAIGMNFVSGTTTASLHYGYSNANRPYLEVNYTLHNYTDDAGVLAVTPGSNSIRCSGHFL